MVRTLIVGATGLVGQEMVNAARRHGHDVHALVRHATRADQNKMRVLAAAGATVHDGELADLDSLVAACRQADNVISAINWLSGDERILVEAARIAGVKRFIPSAYGADFTMTTPCSTIVLDTWAAVRQAVEAAGLPHTYVHTNGFFSFWISTLGDMTRLGGSTPPTEVNLYGDGDTKGGFVSEADIAEVTLRALDDPQAENRRIRITQNTMSQKEIIDLWMQMSGKRVTTVPVAANELDAMIDSADVAAHPPLQNALQLMRVMWVRGEALRLHPDVVEAQEIYPDLGFRTVEEHLRSLLDTSPNQTKAQANA